MSTLKGFPNASNTDVHANTFVVNTASPSKGLDKIIEVVAPNAILNAGGRADEVRCYPGTREEVIERVEKFIDDTPSKNRMLWLSGPAGAGKSAICQTVAERCSERGQQAANFFFFRGDSTRSHSKPLVATLVYQLCRLYPTLNRPLSNCLESDPLICSASIEAQFQQLISNPIETIRQYSPMKRLIIVIVDGLDECNNERDQVQILVALDRLAHTDNSPFRILVSSRAEPQLVMSFNRLGSSVESIFLNEDYQPQEDIRRFVVATFAEIKKSHSLARTLSKDWPKAADIDAITNKSSGQFLYAAIVMRYIHSSSRSPAASLATVLEMPPSTKHNPFAQLDAVFSYIFSKAHSIRDVRLILFARTCTKTEDNEPRDFFLRILRLAGYTDIAEIQSYFADLAPIIDVVPHSTDNLLAFYHASLDDYLGDESRSGIYCVNENQLAAELTCMCLGNVRDTESIQIVVKPLSRVKKPTAELTKSLLDASTNYLSGERRALFLDELIGHIEELYWEQDEDLFKIFLQKWSRFVYTNNLDEFSKFGIAPRNVLALQCYEQYWMPKEYGSQEPLTPPDSAHAGVARSNDQRIPPQASPNTPTGNPVRDLSVHKPGAPPGNHSYRNDRIAERRGMVAGPARSHAFLPGFRKLFDALRRKVTRRQPSGIHEEEEYRSRENENGPYEFSMIRVKLYYQDDIRSMTLTPDAPFSEFVDKVSRKFGGDFDDLTVKFKDKDGDKITIRDDSDYEHAIETARQSSKGRAEGKLEIWCEDRVVHTHYPGVRTTDAASSLSTPEKVSGRT